MLCDGVGVVGLYCDWLEWFVGGGVCDLCGDVVVVVCFMGGVVGRVVVLYLFGDYLEVVVGY